MKKKICIVILSRANFARIKSVLIELLKFKKINIEVIIGGSALIDKFGDIEKDVLKIGLRKIHRVECVIEGSSLASMAKTTGVLLTDLTTIFDNIKPNYILTIADRHETLATAIAARYLNIKLIHTQGGEVTGSVDNNVRDAISMLADFHFPSTNKSKNRLIKMGINYSRIFNFGCPSLDLLNYKNKLKKDLSFINNIGVGSNISFQKKKYLVVLQHPDTDMYLKSKEQITNTIKAIYQIKIPTVWLWPNVDAGSNIFSKEIRKFRERYNPNFIQFIKNLEPEDYANLIRNCGCLIGNSSSAIREGSFLGIPAVNIGFRQNMREKAHNIIDVNYNHVEIFNAIKKQFSKRFKSSNLYGKGNSGLLISRQIIKLIKSSS